MDTSPFIASSHIQAARSAPPVRGSVAFLSRDLNDASLRAPPPVAFDDTDLAGARADGFAEGRALGLAEAAALRATAEQAALSLIASRLAAAGEAARTVADQAALSLAGTLVAALDAVMPELIRRGGLQEAGAMLARILPGLSREPMVRVEVAPAMADGVASLLQRLPSTGAAIIAAAADDLPDGAVRMGWHAGGALREPAEIWRSVMDLLEPALTAPSDAEKDPQHGR